MAVDGVRDAQADRTLHAKQIAGDTRLRTSPAQRGIEATREGFRIGGSDLAHEAKEEERRQAEQPDPDCSHRRQGSHTEHDTKARGQQGGHERGPEPSLHAA